MNEKHEDSYKSIKTNYILMKQIVLVVAIIATFTCCKHKELKINKIDGKWLNEVAIQQLSQAQVADSSNAAIIIGIEFIGDSLATLTTPTESICLPLKHINDTIRLLDDLAKPIFQFVYKPDSKEIELKQDTKSIKLVRYVGNNTLYDEFALQLNKLLFVGKYLLLPKNDTVTFNSAGDITGLKDVTTYAPCIAGDCATIAEPNLNTIWLGDSTSGFYHAWKKSNDTLTMFTLASHNTALAHSYFAHKTRYKLVKVK